MNNIIYMLIIFCSYLFLGCTINIEPKIESTKHWEQHYKSIDDFKAGTSNIKLDDGETIWVISNKTLKRLLINVR